MDKEKDFKCIADISVEFHSSSFTFYFKFHPAVFLYFIPVDL